MRIAAITAEPDGNVNPIYRTYLPMMELASRGHDVYICSGEEPAPERLLSFDVVHFWRGFREHELELARGLRRNGVPYVWDDDDDVTSLPRNSASFRYAGFSGMQRYRRNVLAMMRGAAIVTSPSRTLCARFAESSGATVRLLENYLPNDFPASRRAASDGGVTVCWVAGGEHRIELEELGVQGLLSDLLDADPQVRVITVGIKLGLRHERYEYLERVEHEDLPALLARVDVGLAPLADVRYNQARSNVKLKEYAACGVSWLASPIGPYAGHGEQQGGRLVADDEWAAALEGLVRDGRARRKLAKRGLKWAKGETIERNAGRWEAVLEEAAARRAPARA
jgi:glycosyltransferase involved in cell wall biosynthesis